MPFLDENFLDTDKYGVLKIPGRLWLGIIFSTRYILFFVACLFFTPLVSFYNDISEYLPYWLPLIFEATSALLLIAAGFRTPKGNQIARLIWSYGRIWLALASILNIIYTIIFMLYSSFWQRWPELFLVSCSLIDLVILYTSLASAHINQVFSEFPASE